MKLNLFFHAILAISPIACMAQNQTQANSLRIDSMMNALPEVMVRGEHAMVKISGNALVYDIKRITENKPIDNAYDALKELPGVTEADNRLTIGGQTATLIIDGHATSLTQEQMKEMLTSLPKSRIKDVEVMYNPPARYQTGGVCININLAHETSEEQRLTGEVYGIYDQSHNAEFEERASIVFSGKKFTADFMYSHSHGKSFNMREIDSYHSLNDGSIYDISSEDKTHTSGYSHQMRMSIGYSFAESHDISLTYYGDYNNTGSNQYGTGAIKSEYTLESDPWIHDIALDYNIPSGTSIGAKYTYYKAPMAQSLNSILTDRRLNFISDSRQKLDIWNVYARQEHTLKAGWGINYGVTYTTSADNSFQKYTPTSEETAQLPDNHYAHKRENIVNAYAGFSKNLSNKFILDASVAAEYYNNTVWSGWHCMPTVNATWIPATGHTLQLGISSYTTYPEYWAMHNFTDYSEGGYGEIKGNTELEPMRTYSARLTYVLKNKYVVQTWFSHTDKMFMQTSYQRPDELTLMHKFLNLNFQKQAGLMATAPIKAGGWYNGNITAMGVWIRQKDSDFYNIPLDRSIVYGKFTLHNDFHLSSKPEITLSVNGTARTKTIQGDFDLPASGYIDAALQIKFLKNKQATLKLFCTDIFESDNDDPYINFKGQKLEIDSDNFRHFGISFSYAFGNYKEKEHKEVDTSRLLKIKSDE